MVGIYGIRNNIDGKIYVGQSVNIGKRWIAHTNLLAKNKHFNNYLQHAWNKCGKDVFDFVVLEKCSKEELNDRETYWKEYYDKQFGTYNLGSTGNVGTMSEEHKKKLSKARKGKFCGKKHPMYGKHHTYETKMKISKANKGRPSSLKGKKLSEEQIEFLRKINTGRKMSEETKEKIRIAHTGVNNFFYGKHHDEKTRMIMSKNGKGKRKGTHLSEETKRKISLANKNKIHKPLSLETKTKISSSNKGRIVSQETREKISLKTSIQVIQLDLGGNFIKEWYSITQAEKATGIEGTHISQVCRGKRNKTGGFKWLYKKDYEK